MRNQGDRRAVLQYFATSENAAVVPAWPSSVQTSEDLLRWLDQSGLALYLASRLSSQQQLGLAPVDLQIELERRFAANQHRVADMLQEFRRVNIALQARHVPYAILKGFSLCPEFVESPSLRHQTDIDILVDENCLADAQNALLELGYEVEGAEASGEVRLGMRTGRAASATDFLYGPQRHRQIELHRHFYESVNGVSLNPEPRWQDHVEWKSIEGFRFPVLSLPYRVLGQLLHAFRHVLHGWLRLGWLLEIDTMIRSTGDGCNLWADVETLTHGDRRVRDACAVVLAMTRKAFGTDIPRHPRQHWADRLPTPVSLWVEHLSLEWMLADFPGSRLSLLLHREFADSPQAWQDFRIARSKRRLAAVTGAKLLNPMFLAKRVREQVEYIRRYWYWNTQVLGGLSRSDRQRSP